MRWMSHEQKTEKKIMKKNEIEMELKSKKL